MENQFLEWASFEAKVFILDRKVELDEISWLVCSSMSSIMFQQTASESFLLLTILDFSFTSSHMKVFSDSTWQTGKQKNIQCQARNSKLISVNNEIARRH